MIYSPNTLQPVNLTNVVGITIKRLQKQSNLEYLVTASVTLASGPYNCPRTVEVRFAKDKNTGVYLAYGSRQGRGYSLNSCSVTYGFS